MASLITRFRADTTHAYTVVRTTSNSINQVATGEAPHHPIAYQVKFWSMVACAFVVYAPPRGSGRPQPLQLPTPSAPRDIENSRRYREIPPSPKVVYRGDLFQRPYTLVLGAGFVGGLYKHLGVVKALWRRGLLPESIHGVSAGAIVGVLVGCLPLLALQPREGSDASIESANAPTSVEQALMQLQPDEFLDLEWENLYRTRSVCSGKNFEAKLQRILSGSSKRDLQETEPKVTVQVYNTRTGQTSVRSTGAPVDAVRDSASVAMLFAPRKTNDGTGPFGDGGFVDQHGRCGMLPGKRVLNHRIEDVNGRDVLDRRVGRPLLELRRSADPEHFDLLLPPDGDDITVLNFIPVILDKDRLKRIVDLAQRRTEQYLSEQVST